MIEIQGFIIYARRSDAERVRTRTLNEDGLPPEELAVVRYPGGWTIDLPLDSGKMTTLCGNLAFRATSDEYRRLHDERSAQERLDDDIRHRKD